MVELGRCFLRIMGYLLFPANPEQIILFLWGNGSNGKSTTIDVLREIFGAEMSEASVRELYAGGEDRPASGISGRLENVLCWCRRRRMMSRRAGVSVWIR